MPQPDWLIAIAAYFEASAHAYEQAMTPAFGPLAAELVMSAAIKPGEKVLDLGSGTGLVAQSAAQLTPSVFSLDISRSMLRAARVNAAPNPLQADLHQIPFDKSSFDLVLASFALNSGDPQLAIAEAHRVLKSNGRLIVQEWDTTDELSELVSETFVEYTVEEPPPPLAALRDELEIPLPWDDLESVEDLEILMNEAGFQEVSVSRHSPAIAMRDVDEFLGYKLAWPIRQAELAAMPVDIRALCLSDLHENLAPFMEEGVLIWRPNIVRILANR